MTTATAETLTEARIVKAWNAYLATIKPITNPHSYREVEATAWAQLQARLRRIELTS